MPVHHRLWFLTFPMRTSRLCSLWPDMRPLRFRRVPFGRDVAFDPGGATASRIAMPHMLPSTVPSVSASAKLLLSWLNPPPHPITVYASHPPSPTTAQHSLPGGALPPYRGRSFTGRIASASPDAPEPEVRIHLPPADSPSLSRSHFRASRTRAFPAGVRGSLDEGVSRDAAGFPLRANRRQCLCRAIFQYRSEARSAAMPRRSERNQEFPGFSVGSL